MILKSIGYAIITFVGSLLFLMAIFLPMAIRGRSEKLATELAGLVMSFSLLLALAVFLITV